MMKPGKNINDMDKAYLNHPAFIEDRKREALQRLKAPYKKELLYAQLIIIIPILIFWRFPIINPIKLMVVLFHEFSHVLAAYMTGGIVFGIAIDPGGAGVTLGVGGNQVLILLAGYAGSVLIGYSLYILSAIWDSAEVWALLCILACFSMLFGWLNDFTAYFGIWTLSLMLLLLFVLPDDERKLIIRFVAIGSCFYPLIDIFGDIISSSPSGFKVFGKTAGSDIAELSKILGISKLILGGFWIITGSIVVIYLIFWVTDKEAESEVKGIFFKKKKKRDFEYPLYDPRFPDKVPEYTIK